MWKLHIDGSADDLFGAMLMLIAAEWVVEVTHREFTGSASWVRVEGNAIVARAWNKNDGAHGPELVLDFEGLDELEIN